MKVQIWLIQTHHKWSLILIAVKGVCLLDKCLNVLYLRELIWQSPWSSLHSYYQFFLLKNCQYCKRLDTANEHMKDHIFELRRKIWIYNWSSQLQTQLKQLWNLSLKQIQAWTGFEPMNPYSRCHGFESRSVLKFFQALISQLLKLCM